MLSPNERSVPLSSSSPSCASALKTVGAEEREEKGQASGDEQEG